MANRPAKTIKFPGLEHTYTFLQDDTTLSVAGEAADAKSTGDALAAAAAGIAKAERQVEMLMIEKTNLYDMTARSVDTGISSSTGEEVSKSGWDVSDFIPVRSGVTYIAKIWNTSSLGWSTAPLTNSTSTLYALYDESQAFISNSAVAAAALASPGVTIPTGAAFMRVMCRKNTIAYAPQTMVVAEVANFPDGFLAYGSYAYDYVGAAANIWPKSQSKTASATAGSTLAAVSTVITQALPAGTRIKLTMTSDGTAAISPISLYYWVGSSDSSGRIRLTDSAVLGTTYEYTLPGDADGVCAYAAGSSVTASGYVTLTLEYPTSAYPLESRVSGLETHSTWSKSIAPVQGGTASTNIAEGALLMRDGKLYTATQAIAAGAEIGSTNTTETTLAAQLAALEARIAALEN